MNMSRHLLLAGAALAVAACVPKPAAPPAPTPQPAPPLPAPAPPPPPPATPQNWADLPLSQGQWFYRNDSTASAAFFGVPASEAQFSLRCDKTSGAVTIEREGAATAGALTIRTSFTARTLGATVIREPMPRTTATLAATDPLLDSMAFSRGRFTIEAPGLQTLVIPAWPEPARVIEDCRR